ncbi:2-hydroxyacid dehydrogenase [Neptunomonas qingdaonensis]|uniref:Glycerate dehydrogenase n=1 Tax=Neptunomonas qingdaonensis TaxID=1045558 RepID=A0A1I2RJJ2_9GAMM|nr:2-hydroxyacid dehydrogenase [Neptunomonas qingdaonensis]SFG40692.1 glycerate dehydrogenase [Neptunomonas qingdaonensis]
MNAVFLDLQGLDDLDLSVLENCFDTLTTFQGTSAEQVTERVKDADVIIVNKVQLTQAAISSAKHLKMICVVATGTNNVDLKAAAAEGVAVYNCQAYGIPSVVQHTFSLILALHTNLLNYDRAVRAGEWQKASQFCLLDFPIRELSGRKIGIIGYGHLGQGVAKIAQAFGMEVLVASRSVTDQRQGRISLEKLLPEVDVLSIHCPLTAETNNLIDASALALMKKEAVLVNVARGGVVDEQALADALRCGALAGAATDVLTQEPPRQGNPLLSSDIPNLIVTPHSAWGSKEARQRIIDQTVDNIKNHDSQNVVRRVV